ncbi:arsenate reductase family protein [Marinicrinis lubricantis]|uniref:Arsenate reductase family protein n=1 Tax=Marinicrinis lubricantis TaxID=2086470 RepID=A0ABW1ILL2_9BACL
MKLTIYHYPQCGTCRSAIKWLEQRGHELEKKHIVEQTPTKEELKGYLKSGVELKKLFNTAGQVYREMDLKNQLPDMTEEEQLELLSSNGMLLKRPIVTDGKKVTVGFKEDVYQQQWGA